ncbi:MAG: hypothetical protein D3924_01200 [Candidatus Electrothrix sp. AR4]|nr:hypothetical protein [Candidatus Electrothrix sp. AR4]
MITRYFSQRSPQHDNGSELARGEIEDFFHHHVLVVLGEPGLGKTTSFKEAAKHEHAEFVRIGEFLNGPIEYLRGKALYLDGLDEQRGRVNGADVMDAIIGNLRSIDCPKVRISCRTADWHGENDLKRLSSIAPKAESIVELLLEPLTEENMCFLIEDAGDFIKGARENKLDDFLSNPQTFLLLHKYYQKADGWPTNRTELLDGACKVLLQEPSEIHANLVDDWVTDRELAQSSAYICATCLLSNVSGVSLSRHYSDKSFPAIQEFDDNIFSLKAVNSRRIFKPAGTKRIEPQHRMIAEYMAARFLANRVRAGLSLGRVLALLTGIDGRIPADLRGVYAWLVSMLSGMADRILAHDPYGAIIYGDAYAWRPNTKIRAIDALIELAKKDPWFHHSLSNKPLGGLSSPEIVSKFREILKNDSGETHLLSLVLGAIANGPELNEMRHDLLAFIRSPERKDYQKARAISAFFNACPQYLSDLEQILDEVQSDGIADPEQDLRGTLLYALYPDKIGYERIVDYLVAPPRYVLNNYFFFLKDVLLQKADPDGLKTLAASFDAKSKYFEKDDDYDDSSVIGGLVQRLLERFGESASITELFAWLSLGLGEYNRSRIRREDTEGIQKVISAHPELYITLFNHYFTVRLGAEHDVWNLWENYKQLVLEVPPPFEFPRKLMEWMQEENQSNIINGLFELLCILVFSHGKLDPIPVSFEELEQFSNNNSELQEIYSKYSQWEIPEWHWESFERVEENREEKRIRLARNIETLTEHKVDVEAGKATNILIHFAEIWFARFYDLDREAEPAERLRQEAGDMAECLMTGFVASLQHEENFQSLEEIAKADIQHKSYRSGSLMLAGMDILAQKGREGILGLPDKVLNLGFAYVLTHHSNIEHQWIEWLWTERPDLVECVLDCCWRVQLTDEAEGLTGFYRFSPEDRQLPIIIKILPGLLQDFPKSHPRLLECMLLNAVRYCPNKLPSLVQAALKKRFPANNGQRAMWTAVGFLLNAEQYFGALDKLMGGNEENKWVAYLLLRKILLERNRDGTPCCPIELRRQGIILLGKYFDNNSDASGRGGVFGGERHERFVAGDVRQLIRFFEQDVSDESVAALEQLKNIRKISQYHSEIKNARANQLRAKVKAEYQYPDVSRVVNTLANAEPANVTDLRALVLDALNEIAEEIRHGNTDGWKSFWNLDKQKQYKTTDEHVDENTARDRLLELLRPKLRHLDIAAEPEARYAEEKRADIAVYCKGMKLPIEIKRDDYKGDSKDTPKRTIWNAAKEQLQKQYTRDPASEGNGIYLVFWFGGKGMTTPPKEINKPKPTTAKELKEALLLTVPEQVKGLIDVCVIDVSVPESEKYKSA